MQLSDVMVDPNTGEVIDTGTTSTYGSPGSGTTAPMDQATAQAVSQSTDFLGNIDLGKLITSVAGSYVAVQTAINAGTAPPGTLPHPAIGTRQTLPGGVTSIVNPDGSTTFTDAAGNKKTVMPNGSIVSGAPSWIPGVPNVMLLIAGAGLFLRLLALKR
jgi:hypothetical protein